MEAPVSNSKLAHSSTPAWSLQWRQLFRAPRALFVIYLIKVLLSYAHFSASLILVLWLSNEMGYSDTRAGMIFGFTGLFATVIGVLCGVLIDRTGVKRSLGLGTALAALARIALIKASAMKSPALSLFTLWFVMPLADSLGIPVMTIGVKRCCTNTDEDNTLPYGIFYSFQNVSALLAGLGVDYLRRKPGLFTPLLSLLGSKTSPYEAVFASGAIASMIATFCVLFVLDEVDKGISRTESSAHNVSLWNSVRQVFSEGRFRRFLRLSLILLGISTIYRNLDATLPKYMIRIFGKNAPYGRMYSLEPFVVLVAVPIFSTVLSHVPIYNCLVVGTFIAALSPFWMCLADSYVLVALFVCTLSIGESIYSPRVYQYTMHVAGTGSEGVYSALGNAPLFAVNLVASSLSGFLLESFVPEGGTKQQERPEILWGIVGAICLTSPVLLVACRRFVEEKHQQLPTYDAQGDVNVNDDDEIIDNTVT